MVEVVLGGEVFVAFLAAEVEREVGALGVASQGTAQALLSRTHVLTRVLAVEGERIPFEFVHVNI